MFRSITDALQFEGRLEIMKRKLDLVIVLILAVCATLAYASVPVRIEEWAIPSGDVFPHDPAVAPDGALWYTGMGSNTLGRLDVKTGQFRSYPLKTPDSGPHGLVADRDGAIWFTANYKGYIGRLDPKSGVVTEFPLPDKAARDPHTLVFDAQGMIWFTVQQGNFVGRLDPATGRIALKRPPTADARPYGIAVNARGIPFFCEFGSNRIGSIDPATMAITEYRLPKGARPRRIAISADDMIWYTDYRRGYLGRLDPPVRHDRDAGRHGLVQRIGRKAEHHGPIRPPDSKVRDLAGPLRRWRDPQHGCHASRRYLHRLQRGI
ncbi:MAG: lyase [Oryzomonas sp.]